MADSLRHAIVARNAFVDRHSLEGLRNADDILPKPKRELLHTWIGERAVRTFVYEWFVSKFDKNKYDEAETSVPLTSIPGFEDLSSVASDIVSGLSSLPWKYSFVIQLPPAISQVLGRAQVNFEITGEIRIVTPGSGFNDIPPPPHRYLEQMLPQHATLSALLLNTALTKPSWDDNGAYIQFDLKGFIGRFEETIATMIAKDNLKELFGVGFGLRLLQRKFSPDAMSRPASFAIYRFVERAWSFERWLDIDSPASQLFLSTVLRRSDELSGFVQATVAMEILLAERSETEKVGITELIKNRCAFLLAKTIDEREMIMRDFPLIYDVRSRIVHHGKKRLDEEEKSLLRKRNWLCIRVIWQEARLFDGSEK